MKLQATELLLQCKQTSIGPWITSICKIRQFTLALIVQCIYFGILVLIIGSRPLKGPLIHDQILTLYYEHFCLYNLSY